MPVIIIGESVFVGFFDEIEGFDPSDPMAGLLVGFLFHPHQIGFRVGDGAVPVVDESFVLGPDFFCRRVL